MTVSAMPNTGAIRVTEFSLDNMTNFPIMHVTFCSSDIVVAAGTSTQLFHESYGDFPLYFWWPTHRADPGPAFVTLRFRSADGQTHTLNIRGDITPGTRPTTYSGGSGIWADCNSNP